MQKGVIWDNCVEISAVHQLWSALMKTCSLFLLKERVYWPSLMYVHDVEADMSVRRCVSTQRRPAVSFTMPAANSHALTGPWHTLYLVKETHSGTCADGWRRGDDVTSRRQMCWAWWPMPANAFHPWPWWGGVGAPRSRLSLPPL